MQQFLLDVGHNPQAVTTLAEHLRLYYPDKKIHAVFSMMKDKDIAGVLAIMKPVVEHWYFAPLVNPRAASENVNA
ncbi:glutamate ligase domain-containing protein [Methylocucumis oryzae]|uniref:glutamate ligase domain-containing protein n=1 Tax=Methylocucumis oryzae TaxID=1632867 RepID=UPI00308452ED